MDIFDQESNWIFTAWTQEVDFYPGTDKILSIYYYPLNITGNFNGRLRVYYGNEILEDFSIRFRVESPIRPKEIVNISNIKVYDNVIVMDIKSNKNLTNVLIVPSNYPLGWIFEQKKIHELKANEIERISIDYEPTLWIPERNVSFYIVTEDGKYFGSKTFTLEKESGLERFLYSTNKWLENFLSKIYNPKN